MGRPGTLPRLFSMCINMLLGACLNVCDIKAKAEENPAKITSRFGFFYASHTNAHVDLDDCS